MRIKAVVFDMDGVLVEAKDWHYEALNRALNLYGMNISREEHLETYDGLPTRTKLTMLTEERGLDGGLHGVVNNLKQMYTLDLVEAFCEPTAYHREALKRLKDEGYKTAVASNSVRKSVEVMMEKTQLAEYLDVMMSNEDVERPKPHPDIYLKTAELLGVEPSECLVLEDNKNGIAAAKAAGTCLLEVKSIADVNYDNIVKHIEQYECVSV